MITLTAEEAGEALGAGPLAAAATGVSIDSRSIRRGDLFVALRGERFDGHDYVLSALARGASGAVVASAAWAERYGPNPWTETTGAEQHIYVVENTTEALGCLARQVRRKSGATVLAVTGSVGKTTTKDLLVAMVGKVRRVRSTVANENNEVGVPLTLLGIEPDTEAVVVEMGMRGRGQIASLARIAEPDVGLITNIHPVHLELLGTVEDIAEAKAELMLGLRTGGIAVLPANCEPLRRFAASAGCKVVRFGLGPTCENADVQGTFVTPAAGGGGVLRLRWPEGEVEVETPFVSYYRAENAVAAAGACYAAGLPVDECAAGIADVRFSGSRGDVVTVKGLTIVNDTYNANPAAVRAALEELVALAAEFGARPVAVLGDMLELGSEAERYHWESGAYAAEIGVCALWGVGSLSAATVEGFRAGSEQQSRSNADVHHPEQSGHVGSAEEASTIAACLRPGDVVLFKGSRSMKLEIMVNRIMQEAMGGLWESISSAEAQP